MRQHPSSPAMWVVPLRVLLPIWMAVSSSIVVVLLLMQSWSSLHLSRDISAASSSSSSSRHSWLENQVTEFTAASKRHSHGDWKTLQNDAAAARELRTLLGCNGRSNNNNNSESWIAKCKIKIQQLLKQQEYRETTKDKVAMASKDDIKSSQHKQSWENQNEEILRPYHEKSTHGIPPEVKVDDDDDDDDDEAAKKAHQAEFLGHAMSVARARRQNRTGLYPALDPIPERLPILKPYRSAKAVRDPKWSNTLFPDFTIGGLHKCGTSQLTHILQSHDQVRMLHDERYELFFDKDYHLDFTAPNASEQERYQIELASFHRKLERLQQELPAGKWTVASSPVPDDAILRARYLNPSKRVRILLLTRDPADWLWSAWNFWTDSQIDTWPTHKRGAWASKELHYRSPELFHEFMLAGHRLKSSAWFDRLRQAAVNSPRRYIQVFGAENVMIARNEDMLPGEVQRPGGFLDRLAKFTGLNRSGFSEEITRAIHNCNDNKGNRVACAAKSTKYSIAGSRTMLPDTRKLVHLFFAAECKIWNDEFGITYPNCLSAVE